MSSVIPAEDRALVEAVAELAYCNPFTEDRLRWEEKALGDDFIDAPLAWNTNPFTTEPDPNINRIKERALALADTLVPRLEAASRIDSRDRQVCFQFGCFTIYHLFTEEFDRLIRQPPASSPERLRWYEKFRRQADRFFQPLQPGSFLPVQPAELFALFYQVRRAFLFIFGNLVGSTPALVKLRARVWQSIFTHDLQRYQRGLFHRMNDIATLITGPSGTGKELVAQAIGWSRHIPFDEATQQFVGDYRQHYFPINLAALSPTLIESELFGHRKGAYTGALSDHTGYFESSGPHGTVFLDEIGEAQTDIQVKLLRVLQTRQFQRLGETGLRTFQGKVLAATNRDLAEAMQQGIFRPDLFYRLCGDQVETVGLQTVLREKPDELEMILRHMARRLVMEEDGPGFVREALRKIQQAYPLDYAWPGNYRELEQCLRHLLVQGRCPPPRPPPHSVGTDWMSELLARQPTADELLREYVTRVFWELRERLDLTGQRLDLDRRTVRKYLDQALLERLRLGTAGRNCSVCENWPA